MRRKTLLNAISMVQIDLESILHKEHPYREIQKERKRKVRVHGEQNLKLKRRILAFFKNVDTLE